MLEGETRAWTMDQVEPPSEARVETEPTATPVVEDPKVESTVGAVATPGATTGPRLVLIFGNAIRNGSASARISVSTHPGGYPEYCIYIFTTRRKSASD